MRLHVALNSQPVHARPVSSSARLWTTCRRSDAKQTHQRQGQQHPSHWQQPVQQFVAHAAVSEDAPDVSYEWSWRQSKSSLPEHASAFDAQHPLTAELSLQDALGLAGTAAASEQLPSQPWLQQLLEQLHNHVQRLQAADVCQLLQHLSELDYTPEVQWMSAAVQQLCVQVDQLKTKQLSGLVWSLSNLRHTPEQQHWDAILKTAESKLQDFYGPDLAQFICAAGSIYSSSNSGYDPEAGLEALEQIAAATAGLTLPKGWSSAVAAEVEYQVSEFVGDLSAFDLARIASGLADLGIEPSSKLQDALLKAVYMRTRTIEEKGAVDFALAKLDAKGKRSMHYDPRWTHEELKWLPRRERDKRRIIRENWYRTQWGGYGGGKGS